MASTGSGSVPSRAVLTARKLGGKRILGVAVHSEADLIPLIERGLPLASLSALTKDALSAEEVDRLIVPRRTLSHRKAKNQPLSRAESERAVRVASITSLAEETFGDKDRADTWLRRPTTALGGKRPIYLLESEVGARMVEQLLYRIAYGIAA
jgi:putative toxin-antitoxin system antitoxin component (TIGR02293 family)